ncbi:hypothetical protein [Pradoshia sp.]
MGKRTKTIALNILAIIILYALFASIGEVRQSSKTVDEAFEKFKKEFVYSEISDKQFYLIENSTFLLFEAGNTVSLVQFEKGIFGWKPTYYSHDEDRGLSYSSSFDFGEALLHGVIPEEITNETNTVKVNGIEADIVKLNDKTRVWILINNKPKNFSNINIDFLDKDGHIISEI